MESPPGDCEIMGPCGGPSVCSLRVGQSLGSQHHAVGPRTCRPPFSASTSPKLKEGASLWAQRVCESEMPPGLGARASSPGWYCCRKAAANPGSECARPQGGDRPCLLQAPTGRAVWALGRQEGLFQTLPYFTKDYRQGKANE